MHLKGIQMNLELRLEEILKALEGMEIFSDHFAGIVTVKDGQIIQDGSIIESLPTYVEARILLADASFQKYGSSDQFDKLFDEELGDESPVEER